MNDLFLFYQWGGVTHSFIVDNGVYIAFQQCSKDFNPLHTDESFAVSKGFAGKVMYGNILNAFVSMLIGECLPTKNVIIQSQDIKYVKPVYINDCLEATMLVEDIHESVNVVELKFTFKRETKVVAKGHVQIGII